MEEDFEKDLFFNASANDSDSEENSESDSSSEVDFDHTVLLPKTSSSSHLSKHDVIEVLKEEIGKQLEERAEKSSLTVTNVKTILKQILTHEHVKALLVKGENCEEVRALVSIYKPKLTRAKAKELLASEPSPVVAPPAWIPQPPPSGARVLIDEELKEDDSGDEYVPGKESEDENNESAASESECSSLPPTPAPLEDSSTQTTNYTEDGIFKIPPPILTSAEEDLINIALRTRSKINLCSTPLKEIQKDFVPPDVPSDMTSNVDVDYDDIDWQEFLKSIEEPFDDLKAADTEEHDPEYNILADDQINQIDPEDFREDKGVRVTKKEIKLLWEELFDYVLSISDDKEDKNKKKSDYSILGETEIPSETLISVDTTQKPEEPENTITPELVIDQQQVYLLQQQLRQHVQMLTQNFILTFLHPEFHHYSLKLHEYLLNLKLLSEGKQNSFFSPVNLVPALLLIEDWIKLYSSDTEEIKLAKKHVQTQLFRAVRLKQGGCKYKVTFPKVVMETIFRSEVFLYPYLLPPIPFKSEAYFLQSGIFTNSEDELLVFGLEEFTHFLEKEEKGKITIKRKVELIQKYMMPHRLIPHIIRHITLTKQRRCATNPIQQYFLHKKINPMVHYIYPIYQIIPPCERSPDELPYPWNIYLYPDYETDKAAEAISCILPPRYLVPFATSPVIRNTPVNLTQQNTSDGLQFLVYSTPKGNDAPSSVNLQTSTPNNILKLVYTTPKVTTALSNIHLQTNTPNVVKLVNSALKVTEKANLTSIDKFVFIFQKPINVLKLVRFLSKFHSEDADNMLSLSNLNSPVKNSQENNETNSTDISKSPEQKKIETVTLNTVNQDQKKEKCFQQAETTTEVEFFRNSSDIQICQTSQSAVDVYSEPVQKQKPDNREASDDTGGSATTAIVKSNAKKEPSGAEKKKTKLRKEFVANLAMTTPEDPESEKQRSERFALGYYNKLRENLDLDDYHTFMQIVNDVDPGDLIDLYERIRTLLYPKYQDLAEEYLHFLKEKEAAAAGQLLPWLQVAARVKFIHKLEKYFKDQPAQLRRIYNTIMELAHLDDVSMDKIKSTLFPMLKGNVILIDAFVQNFMEERPPPSLLEGPYETIDINKELARQDGEEIYEKVVVPNEEGRGDKYGGINCACHCHKIEDNEYKARYKHCNKCGLRFIQGKMFIQTGKSPRPVTVSFPTSSHSSQMARLRGKQAITNTSNHRKKRSDTSPSKHATSSGKENLDEDTEDEEIGKRKKQTSQKSPRKRKKVEAKSQEAPRSVSPKKSPGKGRDTLDSSIDNIKPRKRTYSGKKSKKEELKKTDKENNGAREEEKIAEEEEEEAVVEVVPEAEMEERQETCDDQQERLTDDCMDSSGESLEKPLTPGQQTAESENELYCEESSQDNYDSDSSSSSMGKGSQSDNTNDEPPWQREEDTIILETFQKEDDKEYALQIISDKLPHRTRDDINGRFSKLMDLLLETLKQK